jgi:hypothetical protein
MNDWLSKGNSSLRNWYILRHSNFPPFIITWLSLPRSQDPANYVCPEPGNPFHSPHPVCWRSILMASHLRLCLPSGRLPHVSPPLPCAHLFSPPYMRHAPPIYFFISFRLTQQNSVAKCYQQNLFGLGMLSCIWAAVSNRDFQPYKNLFLVFPY